MLIPLRCRCDFFEVTCLFTSMPLRCHFNQKNEQGETHADTQTGKLNTADRKKGKLKTAYGRREKVGTRFWFRIPLGNQTARILACTNETKRNDFLVGLTPNLRSFKSQPNITQSHSDLLWFSFGSLLAIWLGTVRTRRKLVARHRTAH